VKDDIITVTDDGSGEGIFGSTNPETIFYVGKGYFGSETLGDVGGLALNIATPREPAVTLFSDGGITVHRGYAVLFDARHDNFRIEVLEEDSNEA